jgi:hypothetical protein
VGVHQEIGPELGQWIAAQPMFFVASAPLAADGHVNVSPRGLDTFRVLGPREVAYLDLTGSGNETAAHVAENGRITILFCAFAGDPKILRLYGRGAVVLPRDAAWDVLRERFPADLPGVRQIMRIQVERVQTSCGFGVPLLTPRGQRTSLREWAERKGEAGVRDYWRRRNRQSIDGLPAPSLVED